MPFDEFLAKRLTELLRFAAVLVGDARLAADVVVEVLCHAFAEWPALAVGGRPFVLLRTGVVRLYLEGAAPDAPGIFGQLSRPARAAVVLNVYSGQSAGEVADAMRITLAETDSLIAGARATLVGSGGGATLIDRLDLAADTADIDAGSAAVAVLDRLEQDDSVAEPPVDLFGSAVDPGASSSDSLAEHTGGDDEHAPHPLFAFFDDDGAGFDETAVAGAVTDEPPEPAAKARRWAAAGSPDSSVRVLAVLVLVAAAVLISLVVSRDRRDAVSDAETPQPMSSTSTAAVAPRVDPGTRIGYRLPGTRTIASFSGSGNGTERGGPHKVGAGRELAIDAICSGSGGARIGPLSVARCDGTPMGMVVTAAQVRSLAVRTAQANTTWRIQVVDEPAHGTNGALTYPVSPLVAAGSPLVTVARSAGSGPARLALPSGAVNPRVADLRLLLTCAGSGVLFSSSDHSFDGQYTHTCFPGWSYEFDVDSANLPGTLNVQATATTSWRLAVVRR